MDKLKLVLLLCITARVWGGDVQFSVRFTPAAPSLSDTIQMDVSLAGGGENLVIDAADIPPNCVRIRIVSGSGSQQTLTLEPLKVGTCTIPPFRTRCLRGRTDACGVRSSATVIPISTMVSDPEHADIRDENATPIPLQETVQKSNRWVIVAVIIGVLLAASLGFVRRRETAASRARRRLRDVEAGDFTQLVTILRDYLDEREGLGADRCTSPELMGALRERSLGQGSTEKVLSDFLAACDRGRFAGAPSPPDVFAGAVENCDTLIQCLDFDIERRLRAGL